MKNILIVDDNTTNLKMAANVLQPFYDVSMAKSGKQALNYLKKNIPDLILLDIFMPEMDGYETMQQIKVNPETANIPIIFLTADKERNSEIKGLSLGALDYITKPFDEKVMLGRIQQVLMMEDMRKELVSNDSKDPITGLYNYSYLENKTKEYLSSSNKGVIVLLSLSNLSKIKELLSESEVESYLGEISNILSFNNNDDFIAAILNDNKVIISVMKYLDKYTLDEFLYNLGSEINSVLVKTDSVSINANVSIGAEYISSDTDFDKAIINADKALYFAKHTEDITYNIYISD